MYVYGKWKSTPIFLNIAGIPDGAKGRRDVCEPNKRPRMYGSECVEDAGLNWHFRDHLVGVTTLNGKLNRTAPVGRVECCSDAHGERLDLLRSACRAALKASIRVSK